MAYTATTPGRKSWSRKQSKSWLSACKYCPSAATRSIRPRSKIWSRTLNLDAVGVLSAVDDEINGEGSVWIVDGQHRWKALIDLLGLGEWEVEVHVLFRLNALHASLTTLERKQLKIWSGLRKVRQQKTCRRRLCRAVDVSRIADANELTIAFPPPAAAATAHSLRGGALRRLQLRWRSFALGYAQSSYCRLRATRQKKPAGGPSWSRAWEYSISARNGSIDRAALVKKLAKYPGGPSACWSRARPGAAARSYRHASVSLHAMTRAYRSHV